MDCPECGTVNPETARTCKCGYVFPSEGPATSHSGFSIPNAIKLYLAIVIAA